MQFGVFSLGLVEDRDAGVGVFPERQEILVGGLGLGLISRQSASFNPRAFLRQNGVMTDLNTLIPANSPLHLLLACSINSSGQIVGLAVTSGGELHGYLATPSGLTSTGSGTASATNAVVAPLSLTTSQSSAVLDASSSASALGNLRYLFTAVAGGKQPSLLQSASDPKATVEFVDGPGLYLVQLTVTDASGKTSKSPVVMLSYQPAS